MDNMEIPYKVSEIIGSLTLIKEKIPLIEKSMNDIYKEINDEKLHTERLIHKVDVLEKEVETLKTKHEKCIEIINNIGNLQYELKNLARDLESITKEVEEIKTDPKNEPMTLEKAIQLAPSIIAILSFIGFIAMQLISGQIGVKG